ncbi:DUF1295 domain-containing protein [Dyadobacter psychrotolerans]|uniref:DUF1295 domain-containing protein n=1 Tax=Dyadobacter psychrotolerans TaxID=2541721 RepID=A0A4R5E139_9BACT|nr:DUF1295 domain-containing protein [Dyadobacter psychrotolerans]TDE17615.1 DUF1295 domain-containing protein [Dyadobacter psychrotolerans]
MIEALVLPVTISIIACCLIMAAVWFWAYKIKNGGVVDIFWSLNFPVIVLIILFTSEGWRERTWVICAMVVVWGVRLGVHLGKRVIGHIDEEEGRYAQLREDWAPNANRNLFWFFQAQGFSNVLLSLPFFIISANENKGFSAFEYTGFVLWLIALSCEALADNQLNRFKMDPSNEGKVCNVGLWKHSRHPNYFFEWLIWMSFAIFALGSPYGYLAIISPAIILDLLLNVTGIPTTEKQAVRSKGELYKEYQRTTSAFIPWFKKK